MNEADMPSSRYINRRKTEAKKKLWSIIDDFKAILRDSVHPDNQNNAYEKRVQGILSKMMVSANELDIASEEPGNGIFSLLVISFRSSLYLKNEIIKLRKEIKDLRLEVKKLSATNKPTIPSKRKTPIKKERIPPRRKNTSR